MGSIQDILAEMDNVLNKVEEQNVAELAEKLAEGKRIFTAGEGRSGLMAKSFAMRLMHLGGEVFVLGETITPSLKEGDILIAVSGSGTTKQTVWTAEKAREIGVKVIAVTTNPDSPLGKSADSHLVIPAATKFRREGESGSVQPLGSLFDQCAHILFDAICLEYGKAKKVSHEAAFSKHSNME
ncbi:6-phospho-3-hexuloisomerase [Metabacillus sp. GX 13764]|uniref:6-phospho-3-hexuloisomerase n=1 Tax=Metabacillus kandeliae TaxID=2900151 RepID=UPI001E320D57|nr:6-phospho-3-hexuloisomerase [Metabacillus kandeliae]MCD7036538.1 6-phospho-3-hexuloisomerase [Metabacillus kandeliae]